DILDAEDAVLEENPMYRLPVRKVFLPIAAARPFLVFLGEMGSERAVALRTDRGRERMIVRLRIVADDLNLFLDEPFASRRHESRRAAEVVYAVLVKLVPPGVDDDDVARAHRLARRLLQIIVSDRFPLLLGNGNHDTGTEKMRQRDLVDEWRTLHHMRRRIDMGRVVHAQR